MHRRSSSTTSIASLDGALPGATGAPAAFSATELLADDEAWARLAQGPVCIPRNDDGGLDQDQQIAQERAALHVVEIVAELPGAAEVGAGIAAAELRPARDSRLDQQ